MRHALPFLLVLLPAVPLLARRSGPVGPPGLVFEPAEVRLGPLGRGERRRVEVGWRRTGAGPLRVLDVVPGCACLQVEGMPSAPGPGSAGRLGLTVVAPSRPGPFRHAVEGVTDARRRGGAALFRVFVGGWVESPIGVRPEVLQLGPSSRHRRVRRTLTVLAAPSVDPAGIEAHLVGVPGDVTLHPAPEGRRVGLEVALRLPGVPGPVEAALRVSAPGVPPLDVPVRAVVR